VDLLDVVISLAVGNELLLLVKLVHDFLRPGVVYYLFVQVQGVHSQLGLVARSHRTLPSTQAEGLVLLLQGRIELQTSLAFRSLDNDLVLLCQLRLVYGVLMDEEDITLKILEAAADAVDASSSVTPVLRVEGPTFLTRI